MAPAPEEENKAVIRRHIDALNDRDREAFAACFDPESTPHGLDFDEFVEAEFSFFDAFPDLSYPVHEMIAEGDLVAFRWTFDGTHEGRGGPEPLGSIEPTREEVTVTGINIARVEDGKIVEYTAEWDYLELLETVGAVEVSA